MLPEVGVQVIDLQAPPQREEVLEFLVVQSFRLRIGRVLVGVLGCDVLLYGFREALEISAFLMQSIPRRVQNADKKDYGDCTS